MDIEVEHLCFGNTTVVHCPPVGLSLIDRVAPRLHPAELDKLHAIKNDGRKAEWLTARWLIREILHADNELCYEPSGRPYLLGSPCSISISHCSQRVAVAINTKGLPLGIDCETISPRVLKVKHKFASPSEQAYCELQGEEYYTVLWSAKEAIFKYANDQGIDFKEHIEVLPFVLGNGSIPLRALFRKNKREEVKMNYTPIGQTALVTTLE